MTTTVFVFAFQKDSDKEGFNNVNDIPVSEIDLTVPLHVPGELRLSPPC